MNCDDLRRNEPEVRQAFISAGSTSKWMSGNLHQKDPAKLRERSPSVIQLASGLLSVHGSQQHPVVTCHPSSCLGLQPPPSSQSRLIDGAGEAAPQKLKS